MRKTAGVLVAFMVIALTAALAADTPSKYKELDKLKNKDQEIAMGFKQQSLRKILGTLYNLGAVEKVSFDEEFKDKRVDVQIDRKTLKDVLIQLADEHGLAYEVPDPTSLIVKSAGDKP